ncbi:hypothetical protein JB92DRAFT_3118439 [Gautieria morchelliformis]|nr:hypothetical protein JB92DRAFT_3118439 [Gautieria morchelliformis]
MHTIELASTLGAVKSTLHYILSLYVIPEERRTGLVTHFYKDPAKRCFALETEEDWMALKAEWVNQVAKRGMDACIDIVLPPKFFEFLEEAVKVQTGTTALNGTKTAEYEAQLQKLLDVWTCDQHAGEICMAHALNGQHKVINLQGELVWVLQLMAGKPGVDLNMPPNVEYFKFFHYRPGGASPAASNYATPAPPTAININFPPEVFHAFRAASQPPKRSHSPDMPCSPISHSTSMFIPIALAVFGNRSSLFAPFTIATPSKHDRLLWTDLAVIAEPITSSAQPSFDDVPMIGLS